MIQNQYTSFDVATEWWQKGLISNEEYKQYIPDCNCNGIFPDWCEYCLALQNLVNYIKETRNAYQV